MKPRSRKQPGVVGIALILALLMVGGATWASASGVSILTETPPMESVHEKVDISEITGEIVEPPQLSSAASAIAAEKAWYEYVYYSSEPVGCYYLNENTRVSFYDPYDYASSLVMEVDDSLTDWSSNNTLQISYTTGNSVTDTAGKTTSSTRTVQTVDGQDESTTTIGESKVTTTVKGKVSTYNFSRSGETTQTSNGGDDGWSNSRSWDETTNLSTTAGVSSGAVATTTVGGSLKMGGGDTQSGKTSWNTTTTSKDIIGRDDNGREYTDYSHGYTQNDTETTAANSGGENRVVSTIADRISNATGVSTSATFAMSTNNSTTITKTYQAGYFNAAGSPLQWKIVKYTVRMPMKYQVEYLIDDEWVFGDYSYCLLTTIQGTCRAWLQNNVAYYEHWGTGEPVTWDEFWAQFFTEDSLIAAYKNRLYPDD